MAAVAVVVAIAAGGGAALAHSAADGGAPGWVAGVLGTLVDDGTISEAQADVVSQALAEGRPEGHGPWGHHRAGIGGLDAAAEAIGVEPTVLAEALRSGATIAQQAEANGVAVSDVVSAMVAAAESAITQAEEAGRIDADKAAGMRDGLAERIAELVERPGRGMAHRPPMVPEA